MRLNLTRITLIVALLALIGMGLDSLVVESVAFRPINNSGPAEPVNPPYMRPVSIGQDVTIGIHYRGYGNTWLQLTPRFCFNGNYKINGEPHEFPFKRTKWCGPFDLDLGPYLHPGDNTLEITTMPQDPENHYSPNVGLAVGTPFFGHHFARSIFAVLFLACVLSLVWRGLGRSGFDLWQRLIFVTIGGFYVQWMYRMPQFVYSLDLEKHIPYIQFLSGHPFAIFDYHGPEEWHPFLYYWIAALTAKFFGFLGVFDVWTCLRWISFACYLGFIYFGMRTIMRVLSGPACYLALCLLAFWPSGMFASGWIFNDVMIYPLYAMAFYYTLVWYEDGQPPAFAKALGACGVALMVKNSALVPAFILYLCLFMQLLNRRCAIRSLLSRRLSPAWVLFVLGLSWSWLKIIYFRWVLHQHPPDFLGGGGGFVVKPEYFLWVDLSNLLSHPIFTSWEETPLWNLQIKTMLFTNAYWRYPEVATCIVALYLIMVVYIACYLLTSSLGRLVSLFPVLAGLVVPFAAIIAFTIRIHMGSCMEFRYIQPALVAVALTYMLAVQETRYRNWDVLYYAGNAVAVIFVILSVVFFQLQAA